ncbi:MAG: RNA methyltransferase [Myxococcota bacterium]|nr:RNA methyltransferase [Myxococcota bacterium]
MISEERVARMRQVLGRRQDDLEVVLEDLRDPHNASAVLRTADAFGVGGVTLVYRHARQPRISRLVSGHTKRWTRLHRTDDPVSACAALRERGLRVFAAAITEEATPYLEVDWTRPAAIVLGSEKDGCSPELLAAADSQVRIPMLGFSQSLNVSVAAAVLLAEVARQRLAAGLFEETWSPEKQAVLDSWIDRELPSRRWRRLEAPAPASEAGGEAVDLREKLP